MASIGSTSRQRILDAVFLGLMSYASARLAIYFLIRPEGMAPFWFANGIVLAVLLRRPPKDWSVLLTMVLFGFLVNMTWFGFPLFPDSVYGLVNIIEPLIAALIVRHYKPRFDLRTLKSLGLLIFATFIACIIGATIAWWAGPVKWALWWIDDWLGALLVTPALLVFWQPQNRFFRFDWPTRKQVAEMTAIFLGMSGVSLILFFRYSGSMPLFYSYSVLPFLLWATLKFQTKGATIASLLLGLLTLGFTIYGIGPFTSASTQIIDRSISVQIFLAVVMLSHLSLGVALAERTHITVINQHQIKILESVGRGDPLKTILERIVGFVEAQENGLLCSILLLDSKQGRVRHGAAPNLPDEFNRMVDGSKIGANEGSCGAAAHSGKTVIVEDIETHPNWVNYKQYAIPHGLRACWSSPIFSPTKEVLGTFAIYYKEPRLPDDYELYWVEVATYLASIAILRNRNEEAIKQNEVRLRQLFETTHEGILTIDVEGFIKYANPRISEILGYSVDEMVAQKIQKFVLEEDRPLANEKLAKRMRGQSEQHEIRLLHKDGSARSVIIAGSPIFAESGAIEGALGMITDVTEKKNLERQIAYAQRFEGLGNLAGGIAHDFNNVLTVIVGNLSMIRHALSSDHRIQEKLNTIQIACGHATTLVHQILTFNKPAAPKHSVIQIRPVIDDVVKLLRSTVPTMVQIRTRFSSEIPNVLGDATQLHQVVMNLAANGAHATGEQGGTVEIRVDKIRLQKKLSLVVNELHPGNYIRIRVADNGHGMDSETAAKIFDPFFTTKSSVGGTGLGLSVTRGIVKSHGGAIRVRTKINKGTIISAYFPAAGKGVVALEAKESKATYPGNGKRILYLDDESAVTQIVTTLLNDIGYVATGMTNSKLALELVKNSEKEFDLIITDYEMPELSGLDLIKTIRLFNSEVPIILITGHLTPRLTTEARKLGVQSILTKPEFIHELPETVGKLLNQSSRRGLYKA
jgi:PAS domain S-box-containing protein